MLSLMFQRPLEWRLRMQNWTHNYGVLGRLGGYKHPKRSIRYMDECGTVG